MRPAASWKLIAGSQRTSRFAAPDAARGTRAALCGARNAGSSRPVEVSIDPHLGRPAAHAGSRQGGAATPRRGAWHRRGRSKPANAHDLERRTRADRSRASAGAGRMALALCGARPQPAVLQPVEPRLDPVSAQRHPPSRTTAELRWTAHSHSKTRRAPRCRRYRPWCRGAQPSIHQNAFAGRRRPSRCTDRCSRSSRRRL